LVGMIPVPADQEKNSKLAACANKPALARFDHPTRLSPSMQAGFCPSQFHSNEACKWLRTGGLEQNLTVEQNRRYVRAADPNQGPRSPRSGERRNRQMRCAGSDRSLQ
jgi:hypothetical protein